jgi:hypothetical protein
MSHDHGVHVHQPHEEMVEHGAHSDSLAQRVALTTAILATIGALFGYQAGQMANESMLLKNDSIAKKTEESDQWGYYQAKSTREFIADSLSVLATDDKMRDKLKADAARYGKDKDDIKKVADGLHAEALKLNDQSEGKVIPLGILLPLAGEGARQRRADEGRCWASSHTDRHRPSSVMLRMPPSPASGRRARPLSPPAGRGLG